MQYRRPYLEEGKGGLCEILNLQMLLFLGIPSSTKWELFLIGGIARLLPQLLPRGPSPLLAYIRVSAVLTAVDKDLGPAP